MTDVRRPLTPAIDAIFTAVRREIDAANDAMTLRAFQICVLAVSQETKLDVRDVVSGQDWHGQRAGRMVAYLMHHHYGVSQAQIGEVLGLERTSVNKRIGRLEGGKNADQVMGMIERIQTRLDFLEGGGL